MAGIYIHIPYCRQACTYCDFHFSTNIRTLPDMAEAICKEIEWRKDYLETGLVESVYFGGGTPSILEEAQFSLIFEALAKQYSWNQNAEITIEANPDNITVRVLDLWSRLGINRISLGLQSFNPEELRWMNRAHTAEQGTDAVKMAQHAGFGNISVDLIYGSRFQDLRSWEKTLQKVIGLGIQHVSSYNLTIEKKTVLGVQHARGLEPAIDEHLSGNQFVLMSEMLATDGFLHYEISNFAKEGFIAIHNSNYWKQKPYIGLGPSAHSFDGLSRQWNVSSNSRYISQAKAGTGYFERETLQTRDRYNEYVLTRLRTIWGCDADEMRVLFGEEILRHFLAGVHKKHDFFNRKENIYALNKKGQLMADGIASDLFLL